MSGSRGRLGTRARTLPTRHLAPASRPPDNALEHHRQAGPSPGGRPVACDEHREPTTTRAAAPGPARARGARRTGGSGLDRGNPVADHPGQLLRGNRRLHPPSPANGGSHRQPVRRDRVCADDLAWPVESGRPRCPHRRGKYDDDEGCDCRPRPAATAQAISCGLAHAGATIIDLSQERSSVEVHKSSRNRARQVRPDQ